MEEARFFSADSHVMEPYELWWTALGQRFGDRTPRVLNEYQGRQGAFFYSGNRGAPVAVIRDLNPTSDAAAKAAEEGFELETGAYNRRSLYEDEK